MTVQVERRTKVRYRFERKGGFFLGRTGAKRFRGEGVTRDINLSGAFIATTPVRLVALRSNWNFSSPRYMARWRPRGSGARR